MGSSDTRRLPPDPATHNHQPPVTLEDPAVGEVPETVPHPRESEATAAARLRRGQQDPWGAPEDQPDNAGNEVVEQQAER
jgi:hypothetical protein